MRMVLSVHFYGRDDEDIVDPVRVDTIVPDYDVFDGPDNFRVVFNEFEQAALIGRNELGRSLAQVYLEGMSRDRLEAMTQGQQGVTVKENPLPYKIEAELGRLNVITHYAEKGDGTICASRSDIFPATGSREAFRSPCYEWLQSRLAQKTITVQVLKLLTIYGGKVNKIA